MNVNILGYRADIMTPKNDQRLEVFRGKYGQQKMCRMKDRGSQPFFGLWPI